MKLFDQYNDRAAILIIVFCERVSCFGQNDKYKKWNNGPVKIKSIQISRQCCSKETKGILQFCYGV